MDIEKRKNLFDLGNELIALSGRLWDAENFGGEVEAVKAAILEKQAAASDLIDSVCWAVAEKIPAEIMAYKGMIEHCRGKIEQLEQQAEGMKAAAGELAGQMPDGKYKGIYTFYKRTSAATVVDSMSELPEEYKRTEIVVSPDKTKIKDAIKLGGTVPGARLVESVAWCVKTAKKSK